MLSITHPERIIYPKSGITKLDLAEYYDVVHEWMLPYITNRPLTLVRCPQGLAQKCFYQKHLTEPIDALFDIRIKEKSATSDYIYLKKAAGLLALVQFGVMEIHTWGSHIDKLEQPDVLVFDLDPAPDVAWSKIVSAAKFVRECLDAIGLQSFVKTTGGKGLHVVVPIKRKYHWEEVKNFTHEFVNVLVEEKPREFISVMTKAKRTGKIFLDYLRNGRGATAVSPYSSRAREGATVATPIHWDELTAKLKPENFTVLTVPKRLAKLKADPWEGYFKISQSLKLKSVGG
jgi:bifunctional non-homologous end joining protein LigD